MRSLIVANADVIFVNLDVRTPSPPKVVGIPGRVTKSCMVVNETVASPALVHGETPARPPELAVDPLCLFCGKLSRFRGSQAREPEAAGSTVQSNPGSDMKFHGKTPGLRGAAARILPGSIAETGYPVPWRIGWVGDDPAGMPRKSAPRSLCTAGRAFMEMRRFRCLNSSIGMSFMRDPLPDGKMRVPHRGARPMGYRFS